MAKLTRKSYKRKKIAFAAVILGGVALVSSGFAAWVLSANAEKESTGVTTVGTVKDNSLAMNIKLQYLVYSGKEGNITETWTDQTPASGEEIAKGTFDFDPTYKDVRKPGQRVYNDGKLFERLTLRYVVTVSSKTNNSFDKLNVKMVETSGEKVKNAVGKDYVIAPDCYTADDGVTISADATSDPKFVKDDKTETGATEAAKICTWTINYDVSFKWGSFFSTTKTGEGTNPGDYFDSPEGLDTYPVLGTVDDKLSSDLSTPTVAAILNDLHDTLDSASYKLTFTAYAK